MEPQADSPLERARAKVRKPAIAVLVLGVLTELASLASIAWHVLGKSLIEAQEQSMVLGPWMEFNQKFGLAMAILGFLLAPIEILGALKMMKLQSRGLVMAAVVLTMLPISSCCCPIGIGVGIWALMTLNDPEVKAAFGPS